MSSIDVSVIVPCYNVAGFVVQALDSIAANDQVALEVLLVNDGSTDATLELLTARAAADPRFRVINKPNAGYGAACNTALAEAQGSYVAIFEPDDYATPHMYDELFAYAQKLSAQLGVEPDVVKSPYIRVIAAQTPEEHMCPCDYVHAFPTNCTYKLTQQPRHLAFHPSIWSALYRRAFLSAHNICFMEVPGGGWVDNPFMVETLAQAAHIAFYDKAFYHYREALPTSSTATKTAELAFERWHNMHDILDRLNINDPEVLKALYLTGFWHARVALAELNSKGAQERNFDISGCAQDSQTAKVLKLVRALYQRMNPSLVQAMPELSYAVYQQYQRLCGYSGFPYRWGAHVWSRGKALIARLRRLY